MSEMALTAEHLIVIGRGRLIADTTVDDLVAQASVDAAVRVRSAATATRCATRWPARASASRAHERGVLEVHGLPARADRRGRRARRHRLHELTPQQASLEDAFMRLTGDAVEYHAATRPTSPTDGGRRMSAAVATAARRRRPRGG